MPGTQKSPVRETVNCIGALAFSVPLCYPPIRLKARKEGDTLGGIKMPKKRKDGRYRCSARYEGKVYYGYGRSYQEARNNLTHKLDSLKNGVCKPGKEKTFKEYAESWIQD